MEASEPDSLGRIPGSFTHLFPEAQAQTAHRELLPDRHSRRPERWWLHALLFLCTLVTTTVFGYELAVSFWSGHPLSDEFLVDGYSRLLRGGWELWPGILYSIPLLLILLAHEFGHYLTCGRWHVDASLPYFGPAPTLLGTIGAFIRIRSPIYTRRSLFDIGVSGPLAGFVLLLPFLFAGVLLSHVIHGSQLQGSFSFGTPLMLRAVEELRFPGVPATDIALHPMAMAAWAGLLATAINLLPVGQLDGGHITYAVFGARGHRWLSWLLIASLAVCGFLYWPWWLWAVAMFFFRRHPLIYDEGSLGPKRRTLAVVALLLLVLSMCIVPVR